MGSALALGLAGGTHVSPADICISNPSTAKLEAIRDRQPAIATTTDNSICVRDADLVILAVKPWMLKTVIDEILPVLDVRRQAVASLAGGVSLSQLGEMFQSLSADAPLPRLYRVIPNTAIAAAESMTFVSVSKPEPAMDGAVLDMFRELGDAMLVEERLMDAATALASCGIAYALRYVRAATEGGVQLGFRAAEAQHIVAQTLRGAVALLETPGAHPEVEIDKVTTPGGMTIRGLNMMEQEGFTTAVIRGLLASLSR